MTLPRFSTLNRNRLASIRMLATDVDGTVTRDGSIGADVIEAMTALIASGVEILPVSGRPAGEMLGLTRYLPGVKRCLAENGLLEIQADCAPRWLGKPTDLDRLKAIADELQQGLEDPLRPAPDAFCRLGDLAFERDSREVKAMLPMRTFVESRGAYLVWSNVHIHIAEAIPDKGSALRQLLRESSGHRYDDSEVLTMGDAPNDAGLFAAGFGLSVGTLDIEAQAPVFSVLPDCLSDFREADAFLEVARALLKVRN